MFSFVNLRSIIAISYRRVRFIRYIYKVGNLEYMVGRFVGMLGG